MSAHAVGEMSLNISFFLYLFLYVPQSIRNIRYKRLEEMSLAFHALLFIAATADLYYGFGRIVEWQYRCVSLLMFILLLLQHIQLFFYSRFFRSGLKKLIGLSLLIVAMVGCLIPALAQAADGSLLFIAMGWVERICYWGYSIPQYFKNKKTYRASVISPVFLIVAILTALCDAVSAWCLHWGPSSLYGAPIAVALHVVLLSQWVQSLKYQPQYQWAP